MAKNYLWQERVQAFVADLLAERPDRENEHIDQIEIEMEELGDAVSQEFTRQLLARYGGPCSEAPCCPDCGRAAGQVGHRQRKILTTCGPVPVKETKCYCPACRRHFFPSVGSLGFGSLI